MTDYIAGTDLRSYIGSDVTSFGSLVTSVCTVASRAVETMCDRTFNPESAAGTLYLNPENRQEVCFGLDIYTTTGFVLSVDDGTGTYPTTWTLNTDYLLEPRNQRYGAIAGYPWTSARAVGGKWFTASQNGYESVRVVGKPGWTAVPEEVKLASLEVAAKLYKAKDAADDYIGLDGWGPTRLRAEFPMAAKILGPYMRNPISVA